TSLLINEICFDSRNVGMDDVFVAIKGVLADGHQYIEKAIANGANSIVCETLPKIVVNGVTYVAVDNAHTGLSIRAANVYDNPSRSLKLVGLAGANGSTTVRSLLSQVCKPARFHVRLMATIRVMVHEQQRPTTRATPDALA